MEVIGLDDQTRDDIQSLVAGILHLGNLQFVENGNYAAIADPGCKFESSSDSVSGCAPCDCCYLLATVTIIG